MFFLWESTAEPKKDKIWGDPLITTYTLDNNNDQEEDAQ